MTQGTDDKKTIRASRKKCFSFFLDNKKRAFCVSPVVIIEEIFLEIAQYCSEVIQRKI